MEGHTTFVLFPNILSCLISCLSSLFYRYVAELTREMMGDLEASKYQLVEWRVSIYGRHLSEWEKLAKWFYNNRLAHTNVRWLIQVPRLFHLYRSTGK
jgi:AMP deaminase